VVISGERHDYPVRRSAVARVLAAAAEPGEVAWFAAPAGGRLVLGQVHGARALLRPIDDEVQRLELVSRVNTALGELRSLAGDDPAVARSWLGWNGARWT
jgi:hypothetical protein